MECVRICKIRSCFTLREKSCGDGRHGPHYLGGKNFRAALSRGMAKFQGFSPIIFFPNIKLASLMVALVDALKLRRVSQN